MGIVVIRAEVKVTIDDMLEEVETAIQEKRGRNIPRRVIDMSRVDFNYSIEDAKQILKAIWKEACILRIEKVALLFDSIPESFDFKKIISFLDTSFATIRMFVDKQKAIEFLNEQE